MTFLRNPTPPRLPDPESAFNARANAALLQTLRLYFEQLNLVFQALLGRNGGQFLEMPTGAYYANIDQVIAPVTVTAVNVPLLTNEQAFNRPSLSKIAADFAGTYSVRATLSVRNTGAAAPFQVWLRKNAVDIPTTRNEVSVPTGVLPVSIDYIVDLLPTDTFEIMVYATGGMTLYTPPLAAPVPAGAAARINIVYVSNDSTAQVASLLHRLKKRTS